MIDFFVNIGPYGSANFEMPLLLQLEIFFNQTFLNVPCDSPHKKLLLGILEF